MPSKAAKKTNAAVPSLVPGLLITSGVFVTAFFGALTIYFLLGRGLMDFTIPVLIAGLIITKAGLVLKTRRSEFWSRAAETVGALGTGVFLFVVESAFVGGGSELASWFLIGLFVWPYPVALLSSIESRRISGKLANPKGQRKEGHLIEFVIIALVLIFLWEMFTNPCAFGCVYSI